MSEARKLYWDSSCFICLLNDEPYERARRIICEDVLHNAQNNVVEIWTSMYTIAEVIRPKRHGSAPLPTWETKAIEAVEKEFPEIKTELPTLWKRYQANDPTTKLTDEQIEKISRMFSEWEFIKKIDVSELIAFKAVELARTCGLRPADSVHAASAIIKKVEISQRWDRDFSKVQHLVKVEDPEQISAQANMFAAALRPEDFQQPNEVKGEPESDEKDKDK
jgi:predicted nucleic acid-binding protein